MKSLSYRVDHAGNLLTLVCLEQVAPAAKAGTTLDKVLYTFD
jgi:hypothetical protein